MTGKSIMPCNLTAFREYLLREEKSAATIEKYLRDTSAFAVFANGREVTKELIVTYKKSLIEKNYAVRSINSMLASLNSLLTFLGIGEYRVKNVRIQQQTFCVAEKELTKPEYLRLLEVARQNSQLYLLLQTICATGIRVSELRYFTVEAIESGRIIVDCKSKTRMILIPSKLKYLLLKYARNKGIRDGAIFVTKNGKTLDRSNIWAAMKKLCAAAGVAPEKVYPHNLRKLFARTFYGMEKDIAKLADILGHSSINTTRIYIMSSGWEHRQKIERLGLLI